MSGYMSNSALNVKIHAKLKNRISREMYIRMTRLQSVPALAGFLKTETSWGKMLDGVDTDNIHREFLEQCLSRGIINDIKDLTSFASISASAYLRLFSIREEIETIKVFLRLLLFGHPERFVVPPHRIYKGKIDFSGFSKIKTFDEFLAYIDGSIYAVPLKGFLGYGEKKYIFDIEMALDIYYRKMVFKFAKKYLNDTEQKIVKETYGSEVDLSAIMFIIRIKRNFDFPKEQMYFYMRQKYAHLKVETIMKMIEADTAEEVFEILKETKYAAIFEGSRVSFERKIEKYLQNLHKKLFLHFGCTIEAVLYYVKIKEIELRNIITVTEGIRYSMEPEILQQYLIGG